MKRLSGLASIVLAAGTTASVIGCGSTLTPYGMGRYTENTTLDISSESLPCSKAEVWMDKKGYMIQCDEQHGFQRWNGQEVLQWGRHALHDLNADGKLDLVLLDDKPVCVNKYSSLVQWLKLSELQKFYDQMVATFNRDKIHKLWQTRWP